MNRKKIPFTIWIHNDFCRIEANDCRAKIRALSDGACICDIEVLMFELDRINKELAKINAIPVYTVEGSYDV